MNATANFARNAAQNEDKIMTKTFKIYLVIWLIAVIIFNTVTFASPMVSNIFFGVFWIGYIFIMLAFVGQLICSYIAFKGENLQKMFYNISLVLISYISLFITIIVGTICMAIPMFPISFGTVACVTITGISATIILLTCFVIDVVSSIDNEIKTKTFTIRTLTIDAEHLIVEAKDDDIKSICKKVYESLRYSDPMTNIYLSDINEEIQREFSAFETSVINNDVDMAKLISSELLNMIDKRNKKCKQLK